MSKYLSIDYTNYQGKRAIRIIEPLDISFKSTLYHPEAQWLLRAIDVEKRAVRDFAMNMIHGITGVIDGEGTSEVLSGSLRGTGEDSQGDRAASPADRGGRSSEGSIRTLTEFRSAEVQDAMQSGLLNDTRTGEEVRDPPEGGHNSA